METINVSLAHLTDQTNICMQGAWWQSFLEEKLERMRLRPELHQGNIRASLRKSRKRQQHTPIPNSTNNIGICFIMLEGEWSGSLESLCVLMMLFVRMKVWPELLVTCDGQWNALFCCYSLPSFLPLLRNALLVLSSKQSKNIDEERI